MVDYRDSAILRRLVLEKLDANRLAGRDVSGIDAGERAQTAAHPAIGPHTGGGKAGPIGMKRAEREAPPVNREVGNRQHRRGNEIVGDPFLRLVADNVDMVPTGKRAMPAPFPVCIRGGKR